mgnify:CR=1 FL=1
MREGGAQRSSDGRVAAGAWPFFALVVPHLLVLAGVIVEFIGRGLSTLSLPRRRGRWPA